MRFALWICLAAQLVACAPQAAAPVKSPQSEAPRPQSEWKQVEPAKQKVPLVPEPAGVPAPDANCQAFAERSGAGCGAATSGGRDALAEALAEKTSDERDQRLRCLEANTELPPGLVRSLRAELAPAGCADVIARPFLEPPSLWGILPPPHPLSPASDFILASAGLSGMSTRYRRRLRSPSAKSLTGAYYVLTVITADRPLFT